MVDDRDYDTSAIYEIRVRDMIDQEWTAWFDDLAIVPLQNGETLLRGPVIDQAALHGILAKIRDLNLVLISINCISKDVNDEAG